MSLGIDLDEIKVGATLSIKDIIAAGAIDIKAKKLDIKQDFKIEGLKAGEGKNTKDP